MKQWLESKDGVNTSPKPQKAKMVPEMFKPNIKRLFVMEMHQCLYE